MEKELIEEIRKIEKECYGPTFRETSNNTIKAMRLIGISNEFLKLLGRFIGKQIEKQITAVDYHERLNYIYNLLSPYDLKKMSTISYKISGYSEKFQK